MGEYLFEHIDIALHHVHTPMAPTAAVWISSSGRSEGWWKERGIGYRAVVQGGRAGMGDPRYGHGRYHRFKGHEKKDQFQGNPGVPCTLSYPVARTSSTY